MLLESLFAIIELLAVFKCALEKHGCVLVDCELLLGRGQYKLSVALEQARFLLMRVNNLYLFNKFVNIDTLCVLMNL